jgi:hypothetical protein
MALRGLIFAGLGFTGDILCFCIMRGTTVRRKRVLSSLNGPETKIGDFVQRIGTDERGLEELAGDDSLEPRIIGWRRGRSGRND